MFCVFPLFLQNNCIRHHRGGYQHARTDGTAEFYWQGLAKIIAVTGGITGSHLQSISQGEFLANYLVEQGIPKKELKKIGTYCRKGDIADIQIEV